MLITPKVSVVELEPLVLGSGESTGTLLSITSASGGPFDLRGSKSRIEFFKADSGSEDVFEGTPATVLRLEPFAPQKGQIAVRLNRELAGVEDETETTHFRVLVTLSVDEFVSGSYHTEMRDFEAIVGRWKISW